MPWLLNWTITFRRSSTKSSDAINNQQVSGNTMSQVSVNDLEVFAKTVSALFNTRELLQSVSRQVSFRIEGVVTKCASEVNRYQTDFDEAVREENRQWELSCQAERDLENAKSALAACQSAARYDEHGTRHEPDCSMEREKCDRAEFEWIDRKNAYEEAAKVRMSIAQQLEQMQQVLDRATRLYERIQAETGSRISGIDGKIDEAAARLEHAGRELQGYLNENTFRT